MAFKDLREFVDRPRLELPIDGKTYVVFDVDAETALWAQHLMALGTAVAQGAEVDGAELDDEAEADMFARLLGEAYEVMVSDGVGWADIKHAAMTTMIWIVADEESAEKFWESGGRSLEGEAQAPAGNRASRRASAAVARKTRPRVSTSGTKAPRATPAKRSAGGRSSKPGT